MSDLRDRIAAALERNLVSQFPSGLPDRYGAWIDNAALADAVIEELIDLAGHGELLKAIDRMNR